jgi:hypothetical protein
MYEECQVLPIHFKGFGQGTAFLVEHHKGLVNQELLHFTGKDFYLALSLLI